MMEKEGTLVLDEKAYIKVSRPAYRLSELRSKYLKGAEPSKPRLETLKQKLGEALTCNKEKSKKVCFTFFPFLRILRKYKWRTDLINDIVSGLTVGVMQLPQGMAYAMLAELPPVAGLYMSFFPVLVYFFFATSKQISMGTVAVISLMTGGIVAKETTAWRLSRGTTAAAMIMSTAKTVEATSTPLSTALSTILDENITILTTATAAGNTMNDEDIAYRIQIATSVAFVTGLAQIGMGLCRVGFVTTYMSDSLVSGFTTGAAVYVFTSQVKNALGVSIPRFDDLFQVILTYISIIKVIHKTNVAELVITLICIIVLYLTKVQLSDRIKHLCRIPIPIELIVVVVGTLASHYGGFHERWGVKTVGKIPAGMPQPTFPTLVNVSNYGFNCVVIGIVAFAQSVSLASLFAKKYHYDIDANKELIGYGAGTFVGSFFSCYPIAASVSRSSVQDSAGGRTQIASIFSAALVLIVILFIGPLFQDLPNSCLSAIIMVALRSMFLQILELKNLARVSPYDCAIWIVTFLSVVILSVDYGLYIGIGFSFFTVVTRSQITSVKTMENLEETDIYRQTQLYKETESRPGVCIISYNTPLYYANGELFAKNIQRVTGVKPEKLRKLLKRIQTNTTLYSTQNLIVDQDMVVELETIRPSTDEDSNTKEHVTNGTTARTHPADLYPFKHLVIDCSSMAFIDPTGLKSLKQVIDDYKEVGISVYLGGIRDEVYNMMQAAEFTKKYSSSIYLTVYDAVQIATLATYKESNLTELSITHM